MTKPTIATWSKQLRISLFLTLYQHLFWSDILGIQSFLDKRPDGGFYTQASLQIYATEVENKLDFANSKNLTEELAKEITELLSKQQDYVQKLQQHLKDWTKTYTIIKSLLLVFYLEYQKSDLQTEVQKRQILRTYMDIAQDYLMQENINLIYVIIFKCLKL